MTGMSAAVPTAPLRDILLKLCRREDLNRDEAREAFAHVDRKSVV